MVKGFSEMEESSFTTYNYDIDPESRAPIDFQGICAEMPTSKGFALYGKKKGDQK